MKPGITAKDLPKIWLFLLLSCCSHGFFQRLLRCPPGCRCHPEGQIICQNIWLEGTLNVYDFRFVRNASVQLALHMDHNKITHIPRRVFQKFSSLRNLSLSDNCISTLDPEAFFGLRQLRFLDMRNNSITELPINLFEQLVWLVSLDLRQNSIAQVLPETIAPLVSLEQLALGDNPLVCDCQIKETLLWVSSRNVSEGDPPITCILPGVIPRTPWRYLLHMCPGVYRKRASTTTISTSLITSTMSSSETQSCKSATTSSIYEETILITNDSHYNPTLASIMHKVSATPRVEGIANRTASANTGRANSSHGACGNGHYQESTEIIQSLENLNTEIREIWEVLNKQHKEGATRQAVPPPPSLVYPDMGWPMVMGPRAANTTLGERVQALRQQAQQNLSAMGQFSSLPVAALGPNGANQLAQLGAALAHPGGTAQYGATVLGQGAPAVTDPSLVERTRSLRDWLRQARIESADLISPGQATL